MFRGWVEAFDLRKFHWYISFYICGNAPWNFSFDLLLMLNLSLQREMSWLFS
jgi:hypothetical protein